MARRSISVKSRSHFLAVVAHRLLNEHGKATFFAGYYWRIHYRGYLTHEVLDRCEAELARLILSDAHKSELK